MTGSNALFSEWINAFIQNQKNYKRHDVSVTDLMAETVLRMADANDILPVFMNTSCIRSEIPSTVYDKYSKANSLCTVLNISNYHRFKQELQLLSQVFLDLGVKGIVFKGPALIESVYPGMDYRFFKDIDIIINKNDYQPVVLRLLSIGYKIDEEWETSVDYVQELEAFSDHYPVLCRYKGETKYLLELHHVDQLGLPEDIIFDRAQEYNGLFSNNIVIEFLLGAIHLHKHWPNRLHNLKTPVLRWLLDCGLLLQKINTLDLWHDLQELTLEHGLMEPVLLCVIACEEVLGCHGFSERITSNIAIKTAYLQFPKADYSIPWIDRRYSFFELFVLRKKSYLEISGAIRELVQTEEYRKKHTIHFQPGKLFHVSSDDYRFRVFWDDTGLSFTRITYYNCSISLGFSLFWCADGLLCQFNVSSSRDLRYSRPSFPSTWVNINLVLRMKTPNSDKGVNFLLLLGKDNCVEIYNADTDRLFEHEKMAVVPCVIYRGARSLSIHDLIIPMKCVHTVYDRTAMISVTAITALASPASHYCVLSWPSYTNNICPYGFVSWDDISSNQKI